MGANLSGKVDGNGRGLDQTSRKVADCPFSRAKANELAI